MTQERIIKTALMQSASDCGCEAEDFLSDENKFFISQKNEMARKYLELPFLCNFVSYGRNVVVSAGEKYINIAHEYLEKCDSVNCFETPKMNLLKEKLKAHNADVCFMAEYWLVQLDRLTALPCKYDIKILIHDEFENLYLPEWSNALCAKRKELDVLGVGAYDGGRLIGLAACSADCSDMWQIGVDVLPEYRLRGVASALTSKLACEIVSRDKVPFYCCAWSNIRSARNAFKSGFSPAWVEMTVKSTDFIDRMNR